MTRATARCSAGWCPVAEPITWLAIQAIAARLASITVANGWHTDLGTASVVTDRSQQLESLQPSVTILAGEIEGNPGQSGTRTQVTDMDVTVEFSIPRALGVSPELLAHRGRADLVRALTTDARDAAAGIRSIKVTGSRIGSAVEPGSNLVIAQVSARVGLSESTQPA